MAIEALLKFRNLDATEHINARIAGLVPKGILKGGIVVAEPASLQVRIKGTAGEPWVFLAFATDGMMLRERAEEKVLPVTAGITNVIVLRAKYIESGPPIVSLEVMTLGAYTTDPEPSTLIRFASVTPPAGAISVAPEDIDLSFRDSIEGFTRQIIRDVIATKEDLPAVSGFPATAEMNFLANDFVTGTSVTVSTGLITEVFSIVPPVSFQLASPSTPGLSRINLSQKTVISAIEAALTGVVTVTTSGAHGFVGGQQVRISGNSAAAANGVWIVNSTSWKTFTTTDVDTVTDTITLTSHGFVDGDVVVFSTSNTLPTGINNTTQYYIVNSTANDFQISLTNGGSAVDITSVGVGTHSVSIAAQANVFTFTKAGSSVPFTGTGGNVVNTATPCTVIARTAPGVTHDLVPSLPIVIEDATDPSFNVTSAVDLVIDAQTFTFTMSGFQTADSGNGVVTKVGFSLPVNGVPIGQSATVTASNFENIFKASTLAPLINATAIGSSVQFETVQAGDFGNSYTISKTEPGVLAGSERIVLSGSTFTGGVDPIASQSNVDLRRGDIYVVLFGDVGTMELWGYDGIRFRNLTSASTSTLLDFHRRNLLENEKHVTENEKDALKGSVGTPSSTNRYVTQQDTSVLTANLAAALQGADGVAPDGTNRFLTEARYRGERSGIEVPTYTVTGDIVTSSATVSNVSSMTNVTIGQLVTGSGIPINTFISGTGVNSFTLSNPATATTTGVTLTLQQDFVKLPVNERWVVGTDTDSAIQFFNVVFTNTLNDPGGPTEYTQIDFTPVTIDAFYVDPSFIPANELDPSDGLVGADALGIYPRQDAAVLGNPIDLYVKLSDIPDNGGCTILYSKAAKEKVRLTTADMLAGPQRIVPATIKDIENKVKELTFNSGIGVSATTITFPNDLFVKSNLQDFVLRRGVGGKMVWLETGFSIDFSAGTGTGGIVNSFTPVTFPAANTWTRYLLSLTSTGKVNVYNLSDHLEFSTDLAFDSSPSSLATPNLAFTKGEWVFASVAVESNGTNTGIENLLATSVDLFPYQGPNSRDPGAEIIVGDGTTTFGHFSGSSAHIRALATASSGDTIKLLPGTYTGQWLINKDNITVKFANGAALKHQVAMTSLSVPFGNVNFSTDTITSNAHGLSDGHTVKITSSGTLPGGLSSAVTYYIVGATTNTFQLSLTAGGSAVNITSQGTGTHTISTTLTCLNVNAAKVRVENPRFKDSDIAVNLTQNATEVAINDPQFEATVLKNFTAYSTLTAPSVVFRYANVATWTCTDGSSADYVGDFNSPSALNDAHAAASPGDIIVVYPGTYSRITNWTKNQIHVRGYGAGLVLVDGGGSNPAISVSGSGNIFENLVCTNASVGIDCTSGSSYNYFDSTVTFTSTVAINVRFPTTGGTKHFNFHPIVAGNLSVSGTAGHSLATVTCGDGVASWGDYVGIDAISQALLAEQQGTTIRVGKGTYSAVSGLSYSNMTIEGSGHNCVIQAQQPSGDTKALAVIGDRNKVRGFKLEAASNDLSGYTIYGIDINGNENIFEQITFTELGANQITAERKYHVTSGIRNRFFPHTGAPSGYVSWTVGDGKRSFGDFIGTGAIGTALNTLPTYPSSIDGAFSAPAGNQVTFTDFSVPSIVEFINTTSAKYVDALNRYVTVSGAANAANNGTWKVTSVLSATSLLLTRADGGAFVAESNLVWSMTTGARIVVLPGTYDDFIIQENQNDVDLEAWGNGDVVITGGTPLIQVKGNRCRVAGFRLEDTGIGISVTGKDNNFERNRFSSSLSARYSIGASATGNRITDAPENMEKSAYTVSTVNSRADFVGTTQAAIQAAVDAASADPHIKRVYIGAGTYTLTGTVNVPANVTVFGSGYGTHITSAGGFSAFTLAAGGNQTISGIRFNNFTNSLVGPASGVFAYGNWLTAAPINGNVTGSTADNL